MGAYQHVGIAARYQRKEKKAVCQTAELMCVARKQNNGDFAFAFDKPDAVVETIVGEE